MLQMSASGLTLLTGIVFQHVLQKNFDGASCASFRFEEAVCIAPDLDDVVFRDIAIGQMQLRHAVGGGEQAR